MNTEMTKEQRAAVIVTLLPLVSAGNLSYAQLGHMFGMQYENLGNVHYIGDDDEFWHFTPRLQADSAFGIGASMSGNTGWVSFARHERTIRYGGLGGDGEDTGYVQNHAGSMLRDGQVGHYI